MHTDSFASRLFGILSFFASRLYTFLLVKAAKSGALYKYVSVGVLKWAQSDIWEKYSCHTYSHHPFQSLDDKCFEAKYV